jgi:uncharacterized protein YjbJ (UPF0337 family)
MATTREIPGGASVFGIFQHGVPVAYRRTLSGAVMGMNKDQVKGRVKETKGRIKEAAGKLVGNQTMEAKGKVQKVLGEVQAKFGDAKQDLKDATKGA